MSKLFWLYLISLFIWLNWPILTCIVLACTDEEFCANFLSSPVAVVGSAIGTLVIIPGMFIYFWYK